MTDALMDRIKAHRSAPDTYDPPTFNQMADRIEQTEAKLTKAVEIGNEMAASIKGNYYIPNVVAEWNAVLAELEGKE